MPGSPPVLLVFGNFHSFRARRSTFFVVVEPAFEVTIGARAETSDKLRGEPA
jgi:hypothetical protein